MAVGDENGLRQKVRKKISGKVRVKRGFTVDSGAADSVMPVGWILGMIIRKSLGSIAGLMYVAANGSKIPNVGQTTIDFMTSEGTWAKWFSRLQPSTSLW